MNQFYLVIGDWSGDGHKQYERVLLWSNYLVKELQEAYKASCKLTGISFNDGARENFTGTERNYPEADKYLICVNYEENKISPECMAILKQYNCPLVKDFDEDTYIDIDIFIPLIMWFIGLSMPKDFVWAKETDDIPVLNGFWDKNLNVQFGYGLFSG